MKKKVKKKKRKKKKKRYPRDEALYNLIQENEWFIFFDYLPRLVWHAVGNKNLWLKQGRPPKNLYDVLTCLLVWHRFPNLAARSAKGFLDLLKYVRLINVDIPCFKTLCNYQADPRIRDYLDKLIEESSKPLNLIEHDFATDMNE